MEGGIAPALESSSVEEVAGAGKKSSSITASVVPIDLMEFQRQQIVRDLVDHYNDSFRYLSILLAEIEILREENEALWGENRELSLLLQEQHSDFLDLTSIQPLIGGDEKVPPGEVTISGKEKSEVLGVLPKSISIRSHGFLAVDHAPCKGVVITEEASASGDIIPRSFQPLPLGSVQVTVIVFFFAHALR